MAAARLITVSSKFLEPAKADKLSFSARSNWTTSPAVSGFVTPDYARIPLLNRPQLSPLPALRFLFCGIGNDDPAAFLLALDEALDDEPIV